MTILLKNLFSLFRLLNSENGSKQIALGLSLGFILGLSPWFSLQGIFLFLIILCFRVQAGAAFISAFFFSFIAFFLDPIFHRVGYSILIQSSLKETFTALYNMPIIPYTRFNNSVVLGSGVIGIILAPFMYLFFSFLIKKYKETIVSRFEQTRVWKLLKASSLYKWYVTYEQYIK